MNELLASIIARDASARIPHCLADEARAAGLLLHHELETHSWTDSDGNAVEEVVRDDLYAATPGFVSRYYAAGGTWTYN